MEDFYELNVKYFQKVHEKYISFKGPKDNIEFFSSVDNGQLKLLYELCSYINKKQGLFYVPVLQLSPSCNECLLYEDR